MSLTLYRNSAGDISIVMQSVIAETHTITFEAPNGVTINSGNPMSFTVANQATPQNLNVTISHTGTKNIPYTITSPYTRRTKRGQVTVVVLDGIPGFSWESSVMGSSSHQYRIGSLNVDSTSHPMYGQTLTLKRATGQSATGLGPIGRLINPSGVLTSTINFDGAAVSTTINAVGLWKIQMGAATSIHDGSTFTSSYSIAATASIALSEMVNSVQRARAIRGTPTELTGSGPKSFSTDIFTELFGCKLAPDHVAYLAVFGFGSINSSSISVGATTISGDVDATLGGGAAWRVYLNKGSNTPLQTNEFVVEPLLYASDSSYGNLGDFSGYMVRCQN